MKIIVLGVGGMGSAACYHLSKIKGVEVTGIEQFDLGHGLGSSHGRSRLIRKAYFEHPDYVPLLKRAYDLWSELEADCGQRLYRETGILYILPRKSALLAGLRESSRLYDIPVETLEGEKLAPYMNRFNRLPGCEAVMEPEAGFLDVEACVIAHAKAAEKRGASLRFGETVKTWTAGSGGVKVVTDKGTYEADRLVITAGPWTSRVMSGLGLPLKVTKKQMYWFQAEEAYDVERGSPCFLIESPGGVYYGFPRHGSEGLKLAEHSGMGSEVSDPSRVDRSLNVDEVERVKTFLRAAMPGVSTELSQQATCMYTMTPDENFIIDTHPEHANVVFAGGFSGHGFKFASTVGEVMAELATQGRTRHPIGFLSLKRF